MVKSITSTLKSKNMLLQSKTVIISEENLLNQGNKQLMIFLLMSPTKMEYKILFGLELMIFQMKVYLFMKAIIYQFHGQIGLQTSQIINLCKGIVFALRMENGVILIVIASAPLFVKKLYKVMQVSTSEQCNILNIT